MVLQQVVPTNIHNNTRERELINISTHNFTDLFKTQKDNLHCMAISFWYSLSSCMRNSKTCAIIRFTQSKGCKFMFLHQITPGCPKFWKYHDTRYLLEKQIFQKPRYHRKGWKAKHLLE